ncbi:MAG: divergent polysaccharide deacetylase family protein [Pseudomonadales bacterium]|nr:divergent polysaccharide deacetylase family protein [Pseudomonadales bacterium]
MPSRIEVFARLNYFIFCTLAIAFCSNVAASTAPTIRIAIIIDDIGNNLPLGLRAALLPGAITYAVLPHTPQSARLAEQAMFDNPAKEIVVHMPMQAETGNRLGPGGLEASFQREEFLETVRSALQAVPGARGLSNHMGSYLTTLPDRMHWLMGELKSSGYYYVDSKTSSRSTARQAALDQRVPFIERDVFLDHDRNPAAIEAAFDRALRLASRDGLAVVIAHPYRNTLDFLEKRLPQLAAEGISLVNASTALALENENPILALGKRNGEAEIQVE